MNMALPTTVPSAREAIGRRAPTAARCLRSVSARCLKLRVSKFPYQKRPLPILVRRIKEPSTPRVASAKVSISRSSRSVWNHYHCNCANAVATGSSIAVLMTVVRALTSVVGKPENSPFSVTARRLKAFNTPNRATRKQFNKPESVNNFPGSLHSRVSSGRSVRFRCLVRLFNVDGLIRMSRMFLLEVRSRWGWRGVRAVGHIA